MNDKLSSSGNEKTIPIEKKDSNISDETQPINDIVKRSNSKGSHGSKTKDSTNSYSNTKTSSKNFFFTDDSLKDKKNITSRTLSSYQQDIKRKDEANLNDQNQLKKEIENKQSKTDDAIPNENSYNTNSTDSEVEIDFSVSDKKNKNDQEFELKIFSADFSSSFAKIKKVKSEVEQIKNFILQETNRLQKEEIELSINERLQSEVALIAYAPYCPIRKKLFKMGLL